MSQNVVFAVPAGTAWPLPLYELALMTAARADANDAPARFTLVTAEEAPLGIFGNRASEAVASLLRERGIELHTSTVPVAFENGSLSVAPSGSLEADRVVALPQLRGRAPAGLPSDSGGFLPTDEHGQVRGCEDVFAAGDVTAFPVKQGGIATQQADAAARAIAERAGSPVEAEPFRPVLRGLLLTGDGARFMRSKIAGGHGDSSDVSTRMLWWPETKVAGQYLSHYLSRSMEPVQPVEPLPADAVPVEVDLTPRSKRHVSAAPSQVVVGYDGSDRARKALEAVRRIAAPGATVKVVYAHRVPPELKYYEFFQDVLAELERGAQETVESARDAFEGADLDVSYEVRRGRAGRGARRRGARATTPT